ncbi:MAG: hypothetical protein Kow00129_11800 [Thermoleophilia bacterium]
MVGLFERARVVPALALLLTGILVLATLGCGGDADAEETTTTVAAAAPAPEAEAAAVNVAHYEELVGTYLRFTEETPAEVIEAVESKRPLVILFYVSGGEDDGKVREALEDLRPQYPDVVFLTYEHSDPDSYGDLAGQLRVDYPPQLTFVKPSGLVNDVLSGFADKGTINQALANIL